MATIRFEELQRLLVARGDADAERIVEITFDRPGYDASLVDEEFRGKVLTADCPYGTVTIMFDRFGQLRSLDVC